MEPGNAPDLDTISADLAAVEEALAKLDAGTYFDEPAVVAASPAGVSEGTPAQPS